MVRVRRRLGTIRCLWFARLPLPLAWLCGRACVAWSASARVPGPLGECQGGYRSCAEQVMHHLVSWTQLAVAVERSLELVAIGSFEVTTK